MKNLKKNIEEIRFSLYEYLNKLDELGIQYTVNKNPSIEEINRIKLIIEKNRSLVEKD